jgi:hypothetical protein
MHVLSGERNRLPRGRPNFSAFRLPPLSRKVFRVLLIYCISWHSFNIMKRCIALAQHNRLAHPTRTRTCIRCIHSARTASPYHSPQFTIPPLLPFPTPTNPYVGKGKGREPQTPKSNEEEVDDAEWQMRVGQSRLSVAKLST